MTKLTSFFLRLFCARGEAGTRILCWVRLLVPLVAGAIRPCYPALPLAVFFVFVAVHQASADDTAAVQASINNCPFGGTVTFQAGTYNISSTLTFKGNCTYQGQGNPVFMGYHGNGAGGYSIGQVNANIQNITFNGMTFDGGGIAFNANDANASNITITNCTFRNITNTNSLNAGSEHSGLTFTGPHIFFNLNVNHNTFTNITYGNNITYGTPEFLATQCIDGPCNADWGVGQGISVYMANDYNFSDNTFDTIGSDAIKHVENLVEYPHPGPYHIDRNQFYRIHRMPIESQDGTGANCVNNKTVNNNVVHQFLAPYWGSFGISLMDWCTVNSTANGNEINMIPAQGGGSPNKAYGIALEAGVNIVDSNIIRTDPNNADNMISVTESGQMLSNNVLCGPNVNNAPSGNPYYTINVNGNPGFIGPTVVNNTYTRTCASSTTPSTTPGPSLPPTTPGSSLPPSGGGVVTDEFNTTPLNSSLWTLVAPAGGSQSTTGTAVNLVAPASSTHDPNDSPTNNAVRLEQNIGNLDFNVVVKFNSLPPQGVNSYNCEGIMVSHDASNFMRFEIMSNQTAGYQIFASSTVGGAGGNPFIHAALPVTAGPFYLRVARAGDVWTESWSTDGINYTTSGTFSHVIATAKIGPYVTNYATTAAQAPLNVATVDFFRSLP